MKEILNAHSVACPLCGAAQGENCRYPDGTEVRMDISHTLRLIAVIKAKENAEFEASQDEDDENGSGWTRDLDLRG